MICQGIYARGRYADLLVRGVKKYETRSRDMLRGLDFGRPVFVVRAGKVLGWLMMRPGRHVSAEEFDSLRDEHHVPRGDKYDTGPAGKWLYEVTAAGKYPDPVPLYGPVKRHGRSWCEWELV